MTYDDYDADDWIDESDIGSPDEADDLLLCPSCGAEVHEETQQCPHCGDWIVPVYPGEGPKRIVWTIAVILVLASLVLVSLF